jgi:hypothetical protein
MKKIPIVFDANDGSGQIANGFRLVCENCGNDEFMLFVINLDNGDHNHIYCAQCGNMFCDGRCAQGKPLLPPPN